MADIPELRSNIAALYESMGDWSDSTQVRRTGMSMHIKWEHQLDVTTHSIRLRELFLNAPARLIAALDLIAERDAEIARLRTTLADVMPGPWRCTWWNDITHADGCECEAADAYVIEEMDPRCTEGPKYPVLVYDDGSYVLWALDLREIAVAVEAWSCDDLDYGALLGALIRSAEVAGIAGDPDA